MFINPRFKILGFVVIAAAAILGAWLVIAVSPKPLSAQTLLDNAQTETSTVGTYKFTMSLWQTPQIEGDPPRYETLTEGVVVFDKGMHVVITRSDNSHSESLLLDNVHYRRDQPDGAWEQYPHSFDSSAMTPLDSNKHFQVINGLVDLSIVGEETIRSTRVSKVTGRYDLRARALSIWGDVEQQDAGSRDPREQMLAGTEEFVGWVGIEDGLIHAYEVSGSYPGAGELLPFEFWYRVDFSDFNESLVLPSVN